MLGQGDSRLGGDAGAPGGGVDDEDERLVQRISDVDGQASARWTTWAIVRVTAGGVSMTISLKPIDFK